jgi:hypothetical protein
MKLDTTNKDSFFKTIRNAFGSLTQTQVDSINDLLTFIQNDSVIYDVRHFAYLMATVKHETADTYSPIEEYGRGAKRAYGQPDAVTGHTYYGRGYVQLTWKDNYTKLSPYVGVDLVSHPELALDPAIAYKILSRGMVSGLFTGKKLLDYINPNQCDYIGARHIINGTDKAQLIAGYAKVFEKALRGV